MKHIYPLLTMLARKVSVIPILLSLHGCAGEETATTADGQAAEVPAQSSSTLLIDNKLPPGVEFANFKDASFHLDPSSLLLNGSRLFLKLSRSGNEVLYLGEIDRFRTFSIAVQIRLDDTQLFYELFTDDLDDLTQFGVINL